MPDIQSALKDSINLSDQPVTPAENGKPRQSLFILYYRQGQNPHTVHTMFFGSGSFNQIVSTAKNYCETMNMRFVTVKPAIINFEEEIKKLNRTD